MNLNFIYITRPIVETKVKPKWQQKIKKEIEILIKDEETENIPRF